MRQHGPSQTQWQTGHLPRKALTISLFLLPLFLAGCDDDSKADQSAAGNSETQTNTAQPSFLFVQQAESGAFTPTGDGEMFFTLNLQQASPLTTWFTDKPVRKTGTLPTVDMLNIFLANGIQPNAALEIPSDQNKSDVVAFTILDSSYNEETATLDYEVRIIEGDNSQIIPGYESPNTSLDPNTTTEVIDALFDRRFERSYLFIDNLSAIQQEAEASRLPTSTLEPLVEYDYGNGIKTYDPCCAKNPPADCLANFRPICRPADPGVTEPNNYCLDIYGNVLGCTPITDCPDPTDFCNKILGRFYCCNWEI